MRRMVVCVLALAFSPGLAATQVPPPRDATNLESKGGTAVVRGRVSDADTGAPMARVTVSLSRVGRREQVDTKSDANGAFEFMHVPAGAYALSADPIGKTTHRAGGYGVIAGKPPGKHSTIVLREGQVFDQADIALPRSFVISARVVDDDGEPVADMLVRANALGGGGSSRSRSTDDRGAVRLWGYSPGAYTVCALPHHMVDGPAAEGFILTCHPSAASEAEAQPLIVTTADPPEVEIRLRRTRLFRISGFVLDATGSIVSDARVSVITRDRDGGGSSRSTRNEGGSFRIRGLAPGEYFIKADVGNMFNPDDRTRQSGYAVVDIQSADVENVAIVMSPPSTLRGRLIFDGGAPQSTSATIQAYPARNSIAAFAGRGDPPSRVNDDLTFELRGLFGPHTVAVNGPSGWIVKSMKYRGEERINVPTEFRSSDGAALEIVLTNRPARLAARVLDEKGQPVEDARVLLFPADPRQWDGGGDRSVWRMGVQKEGQCWFIGLRPAEYLLAVLPDGMPFQDRDRRPLEELSKHAERITLLENDNRTIDLTIRK